jgi:hypothetical protein
MASAAAAAAGGGAGVLPAAVRVQVRRLQPVLPGARGRAAGRAGDHGVLPGGVAVQVRQPALHAVNGRPRRSRSEGGRWPGRVRRPSRLERGLPLCARAQRRSGAALLLRAGVARRAWAGSAARVVATYHRPARLCVSFFRGAGIREARAGIRRPALPRGVQAWRAYGGVSACWIEPRREASCDAAAGPAAHSCTCPGDLAVEALICSMFSISSCAVFGSGLVTKFCGPLCSCN